MSTSASAKQNESGVTPNIGVPSSDKASSTTKSAIAAGTVQNHNGEKINLESLSREANTVTDALGKIFDKTSVKEKQELSQRFGEEAYNLVHVISEENGWTEGSSEKIALHAMVGALMAKLGSGDVLSGAAGAGFNQALQGELSKIQDPAARQWASAFVGAAAAKVIMGNAQTGASTAASGTKNNDLWESTKQWAVQAGVDAIAAYNAYQAAIKAGFSPAQAQAAVFVTGALVSISDNNYNWSAAVVKYCTELKIDTTEEDPIQRNRAF